MVRFLAELVVVGGGSRENGGFMVENTDTAAVALEDFFELHGVLANGLSGSRTRIVGESESDFSFGEIFEIREYWLGEETGEFQGAAETVDIRSGVRFKNGEFGGDLADGVAKESSEFGKGKFGLATEDGEIFHMFIIP